MTAIALPLEEAEVTVEETAVSAAPDTSLDFEKLNSDAEQYRCIAEEYGPDVAFSHYSGKLTVVINQRAHS
jgi:hypothetical protein